MPSSRAASATGGGASLRPRPFGASGRVTTSAGRCGDAGEPSQHRGRERRGAEVDGAHAATPRPRGPARARAAPARPPCAGRACAVEDEHAVEVVDLVLDDPRLEPAGLHHHRPSRRRRGRARRTCIGRSTSTCTPGRLRQPSSPHSLSRLDHSIDGVDERLHRAVGLGAVDEQPVRHARLRRGEPDPDGLVHQHAPSARPPRAAPRRSARPAAPSCGGSDRRTGGCARARPRGARAPPGSICGCSCSSSAIRSASVGRPMGAEDPDEHAIGYQVLPRGTPVFAADGVAGRDVPQGAAPRPRAPLRRDGRSAPTTGGGSSTRRRSTGSPTGA